MQSECLIGVDEVGRGPLAGPVAVGVVLVSADFDWGVIPGVTDSKLLSEGKREEIAEAARRLAAAGQLNYQVAMVGPAAIDQVGIVPAINRAMNRALMRVEKNVNNNTNINVNILAQRATVLLDGGLRAPERFTSQHTIIKGDQQEPVIGLASIVAKVARDRRMRRLAARAAYTPYDFATHKGYGTKAHQQAIIDHGLSDQHRTTFCKNIKIL